MKYTLTTRLSPEECWENIQKATQLDTIESHFRMFDPSNYYRQGRVDDFRIEKRNAEQITWYNNSRQQVFLYGKIYQTPSGTQITVDISHGKMDTILFTAGFIFLVIIITILVSPSLKNPLEYFSSYEHVSVLITPTFFLFFLFMFYRIGQKHVDAYGAELLDLIKKVCKAELIYSLRNYQS